MKMSETQLQSQSIRSGSTVRLGSHGCGWAVLMLASLATVAAAQSGNSQNNSNSTSVQSAGPGRAWTVSPQIVIPDPQAERQNFAAANAERKKQISEDSERLLKMATDLKAEVDKTNQDTLSVSVIRKADDIEKLAHSVKEKMKLSVGSAPPSGIGPG